MSKRTDSEPGPLWGGGTIEESLRADLARMDWADLTALADRSLASHGHMPVLIGEEIDRRQAEVTS